MTAPYLEAQLDRHEYYALLIKTIHRCGLLRLRIELDPTYLPFVWSTTRKQASNSAMRRKIFGILWAAFIYSTAVHAQSVLVVTVVVRKHCGSPIGPPSTKLPAGLTYSTSSRSHNGVSSGKWSTSNAVYGGSSSRSSDTEMQSPQSYFSAIAGYHNTTSTGPPESSPTSLATNLPISLSSAASTSFMQSNG